MASLILASERSISLSAERTTRGGRPFLEFLAGDVMVAARPSYGDDDEAVASSLEAHSVRIKAMAAEEATGDVVILLVAVLGAVEGTDRPFEGGPFAAFVSSDLDFPLGVLRRGWQDRLHPDELETEVRDMIGLLLDVRFRNLEADAVDTFLASL